MLGFFTNKNTMQEDALSGDPKRYERLYENLLYDKSILIYVEGLLKGQYSQALEAKDIIIEVLVELDRTLLAKEFRGDAHVVTYFKKCCFYYQ
jgi:hypothetical protein